MPPIEREEMDRARRGVEALNSIWLGLVSLMARLSRGFQWSRPGGKKSFAVGGRRRSYIEKEEVLIFRHGACGEVLASSGF